MLYKRRLIIINKVAFFGKIMFFYSSIFGSISHLKGLYPEYTYETASLYVWSFAALIASIGGAIRLKRKAELLFGLGLVGWGLAMEQYTSYHGILFSFAQIAPIQGYCLWVLYRLESKESEETNRFFKIGILCLPLVMMLVIQTYAGDSHPGKVTGKGSLTTPNGDRYEGDLLRGKMNGKGSVTMVNGNFYKGEFVDGKASGKGNLTLANGNSYDGDFVDNKKKGKGIYRWANGDRYEGGWIDDKMSGKGVYTWNNGNRYEGDWSDDERSGKGIYYSHNGSIREGRWSNNNYVGP